MRAWLPFPTVCSIRLSTWRALFAAYGAPPGVPLSCDAYPSIADALLTSDLPDPLARALFTIAAFLTDGGRIDLHNAATLASFSGDFPDADGPADLVAALLARAPSDPNVQRLLDAAQIPRDRAFRPLSTLAYVAARPAPLTSGVSLVLARALQSEIAAWSARLGLGEVFPVRFAADGHRVSFEILHEDRLTTVVSAPAGAPVRTSFRALRAHHLTVERDARGLLLTTDALELATPIAAAAGAALVGDARHFLDAPGVELWRLQEFGAAALEVPELAHKLSVIAVGGTWHSGKSHAITPRGRDFFKALARYKIRIEGGRLEMVTLRATVYVPGGPPRHCDIVLRPPHLVTISDPELAPLLYEFLDLAKITHPDARPVDFFSMQPWIATRAEWIALVGEEGLASLVASGVLRADPANRSVAAPAHPRAGPTATAYPLHADTFLAWSADPTIAPFLVREADLVVYALSFDRLARAIASELGLEGPATALDDDGVLYCGRRSLATTHALVFLPTRPLRAATIARLREAAAHGHAVLVLPEGRMREQGLRAVPMPNLAGPWRPLLGAVVRALHVEAFVETTLYAPPDARFVLHRATQRVWLDGVACTAVTEMQFKALEFLVRHAGQPVHTKDIAEHVTGGNFHEDTTRRTIEGLFAAIAKSFMSQKKKPPRDLESLVKIPKRGHYKLNATGFVD